jgi:hypothetical protein
MDYFSMIFNSEYFNQLKTRWLKTKEILLILKNIEMFVNKGLINISGILKERPKSNTFYLLIKAEISIYL